MHEIAEQSLSSWRRPLWIGLLVFASVPLSLRFACAMPFAAFCSIAAFTLPRRHAYYLTAAVWLANQGVGFAFLHYPWEATCFAWGGIMGLAALLSTGAARLTMGRLVGLHALVRYALVFLAAFACYQAIMSGFVLVSGKTSGLTAPIFLQSLGINALVLLGLLGLNFVGRAIGFASGSPTPATEHRG